jgi:hypothetical protein
VLEYARRQIGTTAILDDRAARRASHALGVSVTGTLGVVTAAVHRGLLPSLVDAINAVRKCGLYVDELLVSRLITDREVVARGLLNHLGERSHKGPASEVTRMRREEFTR